ncbi:hypothetical protein [Agaribacterium haliotis]|uniref:hypothetical protein n=1 Tax=Agaribacterium haliotis TaxID=2013869 RepID=UPI000BB559F7|nr:hypothetical protein [Agaribacterium haliotis]
MLFRLFVTSYFVCISHLAIATPKVLAPPELEQWRDWLLFDHDDVHCPYISIAGERAGFEGGERSCLWVSETELRADQRGLDFTVRGQAFAPQWLLLPGDEQAWPEQLVRVSATQSSKALPVRAKSGRPEVQVDGAFVIRGRINWPSMPANLALPNNSGLVHLFVDNKAVPADIDADGALWLRRQQSGLTSERNSEDIQVFRKLDDGNPARLTTRLQLNISGQARELRLGQVLLDNFVALKLNSQLPARLEKNGDLRVQVKPGRWQLSVEARHVGPLSRVSYRQNSELWPETELWAFVADRSLRSVQLAGAAAVDPSQTLLPEAWKQFPSFRLQAGETLTLTELHRGASLPDADELNLKRKLYLDFDGAAFTVSDAIQGQLKQSWRLDSSPELQLGSVRVDGQAQLITRSQDGKTQGLELRHSDVSLQSVARMPAKGPLPVSGWLSDFDAVSAELHLPPAWSLIASTGVDKVRDSWLSSWSLWNIFVLSLIVVAVYRLMGWRTAGFALVTLLLIFQRQHAPVLIWLNLLAAIALAELAKAKLALWLRRYQALSFLALIILLLPFAVQQLRLSVYPHLASMNYQDVNKPLAAKSRSALPAAALSDVAEQAYSIAQGREKTRPAPYNSAGNVSQQYDLDTAVQTGPGLPQWRWQRVRLNWSGPITSAERMSFVLAPPWLNRLGYLLSAVMSMLLAFLFLRNSAFFKGGRWQFLSLASAPAATGDKENKRADYGDLNSDPNNKNNNPGVSAQLNPVMLFIAVLIVAVSLYAPQSMAKALAPEPPANNISVGETLLSEKLLTEYQRRLIAKPDCLDNCLSIQAVELNVEDDVLSVQLFVDAQAHVVLALPAWRTQWLPTRVEHNGQAAVLQFSTQGQLYVPLERGRHRIFLHGKLERDQVSLNFSRPLHNVRSQLQGWQLSGVNKRFAASGTVQLQRLNKNSVARELLLPDPIEPFVEIKRELLLGLQWRMKTTVRRIAPRDAAVAITVPLVQGESPVTELERDAAGVKVLLGARQRSVSWDSVLEKTEQLSLIAAQNTHSSELWTLSASPVWHVDFTGIAALKQSSALLHTPSWRPWPGERVDIRIQRAAAAPGQSLTIEQAKLVHRLGQRASHTELNFSARTSRAVVLPFTLPKAAVLESLSIDGRAQPLLNSSGKVDLSLTPGAQNIELKWRSDDGIGTLSKSPSFSMPLALSNLYTELVLPGDRWVLALGGPSIGPVVLFWGIVLSLLLFSWILARLALTPLGFWQWFLLGLGICSTNLYTPAVVAACLLVLGARGRLKTQLSATQFKLMQLALLCFAALSLCLLLATIPMGLLSSPDMLISGNNSYANSYAQHLNWYEDRSAAAFSDVWVFSLPLWAYRVAMLAWSLWLAFSLLRWLSWAWLQLNVRGFWPEKASSVNT